MALAPVKPLYSASATATNGSDTITVTGGVNCSFIASGAIVSLGTRQLVDAISGTAPDGSGNSTIKLRRPWDDPTTTGKLLVFMSWEGLADAVNRLREIIDASEASVQGAFSFMGNWSAVSGNFPTPPGAGLGSQIYRVSAAGTMGGRAYRVGEGIYYDQYTSQWRSTIELATAFSTGLLQNTDGAAWRSALGLVKTTSAADATAGRITQVGDGGLLADLNNPVNPENIPFTTFFVSNTANSTDEFSADYYGINFSRAGAVRRANLAIDAGVGGVRLGVRRFDGSAWTPWLDVYHQANILGTVSQAAGIPTGAVIERGSNANGEYVKYADGTMICTKFILVTTSITTAAGALFWSGITQSGGNFAANFIANPYISISTSGANASFIAFGSGLSPTQVGVFFHLSDQARGSATYSYAITAVGRWY